MANNVLMCGFRKNTKESTINNLNAQLYTTEVFRSAMSYIDTTSDTSDQIFRGTFRLTTNDILEEIEKGPLWCESKYFCYLFKRPED